MIAIIGVLIALLLPAVQQAREAARRSQCSEQSEAASPGGGELRHRLRHSAFDHSSAPTGARLAWLTQVLPYLDQQGLYDKYDQSQNWSTAVPNTAGRIPGAQLAGLQHAYLVAGMPFEQSARRPIRRGWMTTRIRTPKPRRGKGLLRHQRRFAHDGRPAPRRGRTRADTGPRPVRSPVRLCGGERRSRRSCSSFPMKRRRNTPPAATTEPAAQIAYAATVLGGSGASAIDGYGFGILQKNAKPRLADVRDGLSNTVLLAESAGRPWLWTKANGKLVKVTNSDGDIGASREAAPLPITHDRVNGGGWSRPASDISLLGSDPTGTISPVTISTAPTVSASAVAPGPTQLRTDYISGGSGAEHRQPGLVYANLATALTPQRTAVLPRNRHGDSQHLQRLRSVGRPRRR